MAWGNGSEGSIENNRLLNLYPERTKMISIRTRVVTIKITGVHSNGVSDKTSL